MVVHFLYKSSRYRFSVCERAIKDYVVFQTEKDIKNIANFLPKESICKNCFKKMDYFLARYHGDTKPLVLTKYFKPVSELMPTLLHPP